jgi:hypothetical protein
LATGSVSSPNSSARLALAAVAVASSFFPTGLGVHFEEVAKVGFFIVLHRFRSIFAAAICEIRRVVLAGNTGMEIGITGTAFFISRERQEQIA